MHFHLPAHPLQTELKLQFLLQYPNFELQLILPTHPIHLTTTAAPALLQHRPFAMEFHSTLPRFFELNLPTDFHQSIVHEYWA